MSTNDEYYIMMNTNDEYYIMMSTNDEYHIMMSTDDNIIMIIFSYGEINRNSVNKSYMWRC